MLPFPGVAVTLVGALGVPNGVTAVDASDSLVAFAEFLAVTLNVYDVPFVRPRTVAEVVVEVVPVHDAHAGVGVIVYPVIAEPPVLVGAVHVTVADPDAFPLVTVVMTGLLNAGRGMRIELDVPAAPAPALFVAVKLNVYEVPPVKPPTVAVVEVPVNPVIPVHDGHAGVDVRVYDVIVPAPVGAVQLTVAVPAAPATAVTVGALGSGNLAVILLDVPAALVPALFVAVKLNVYEVPAVKPLTVAVLELPVSPVIPVHDEHVGVDVRVYDVIVPPPVEGSDQVTVAVPEDPAVAVTVGAPGAVTKLNSFELPAYACKPPHWACNILKSLRSRSRVLVGCVSSALYAPILT